MQAGVAYMLTQLCKMMILATFFPPSDLPEETFDIIGVCTQCCYFTMPACYSGVLHFSFKNWFNFIFINSYGSCLVQFLTIFLCEINTYLTNFLHVVS